MKIVIDTNVVVSAIFFGGRPRALLELLVSHKLEAYVSTAIVTEYRETIEELCTKYPDKPPRLPLTAIVSAMKMIEPTTTIDICRDPDDNKFLECAFDADCIYIVSGDKDLLSLGTFSNIQIVTVSDFFIEYCSPETT